MYLGVLLKHVLREVVLLEVGVIVLQGVHPLCNVFQDLQLLEVANKEIRFQVSFVCQ